MVSLSLALREVLAHKTKLARLALETGVCVEMALGEMNSLYALAADYSFHDEEFYKEAGPLLQECQAVMVQFYKIDTQG